MRGLAALLVFLSHVRNHFFIDFPEIASHKWMYAPIYLFTSGGHQAVVIFFVLSGYLISSSVFRMLDAGAWSWRAYLLHRVVRLWVVLIPCLLLTVFWDRLGLHSGHAPLLYNGLDAQGMHIRDLISAKVFFGNLFFLQVIHSPTLGSNGALWSLSYEFWYYMLFPLGLFALRRETKRVERAVCVVMFVAVAWFVWPVVPSFPVWLAGTALALVPPPRVSARVRWAAIVVYLGVFFAITKAPSLWYGDYIVAVITFVCFWILLSATTPAKRSLGEATAREMSRFSYTLYLAHTPVTVIMAAFLVGDSRWFPTVGRLLEGFAVVVFLLVYSYGLAMVTEFRTDKLRRRLEAWLGMPRDRSSVVSRT